MIFLGGVLSLSKVGKRFLNPSPNKLAAFVSAGTLAYRFGLVAMDLLSASLHQSRSGPTLNVQVAVQLHCILALPGGRLTLMSDRMSVSGDGWRK